MRSNLFKDLLNIVGGGGIMIIVLAIILYWAKVIPPKDVMVFIVWAIGSASVGTLIGLLSKTTDQKTKH
ncbi:MAG TPA: hypothetical protein DCS93_25930 [Microscillaceae bacterium]|nr:hypothetical protein [Microscillaceae bacterium]